MRYLLILYAGLMLFSCSDQKVAGPREGYFYLTTPSGTSSSDYFKPYDREIQFNSEYIVGFKRGFDRKQVLREVYEVSTHKLYRFLTHQKNWLVYVEQRPETLIDVRSDVPQDFYDARISRYEDGDKNIHGFETQTLLYRDKQGSPKKMWIAATIPFYLGHIPAFGKHVKGMPIEISEDSGLGLDVKLFSMTYFDRKVNEAAFSTSMAGYKEVDKAGFDAALQEVIKENSAYTDIGETELENWKNNLLSLFMF
jgi:hypothetical protein